MEEISDKRSGFDRRATWCGWIAFLGALVILFSVGFLRDLERTYPVWPRWPLVWNIGALTGLALVFTGLFGFLNGLIHRRLETLLTGGAAIVVLAAIVFSGMRACCGSNESSAVAILRTIATAELTHIASPAPKTPGYRTLSELIGIGVLDSRFNGRKDHGYKFEIIVADGGKTYTATAEPISPDSKHSYHCGPDGVIRDQAGKPVEGVHHEVGSESSNDEWAIENLRTIVDAVNTYAGPYASIEDLAAEGLLDSRYSSHAPLSGYKFDVPLINGGSSFRAAAEPASPYSARYAYSITTDYVARYTTNAALAPANQAGAPVQ